MFQDNCYYGLLRFPDLDFCLTTSVTGGQRGLITPPRHIQRSVFAMHSFLYCFFIWITRLIRLFDAVKYAYLINKGFTFKNLPFIDAIFACVSLGISNIREHNYCILTQFILHVGGRRLPCVPLPIYHILAVVHLVRLPELYRYIAPYHFILKDIGYKLLKSLCQFNI